MNTKFVEQIPAQNATLIPPMLHPTIGEKVRAPAVPRVRAVHRVRHRVHLQRRTWVCLENVLLDPPGPVDARWSGW